MYVYLNKETCTFLFLSIITQYSLVFGYRCFGEPSLPVFKEAVFFRSISNQLTGYTIPHHRRRHYEISSLWKHYVMWSVVIIIHGLGRLTCSVIDVSWGVHDLFIVGVCSWGRISGVCCCPFFPGGWSHFVCVWFLYLIFQGSLILFLWFCFLFCQVLRIT